MRILNHNGHDEITWTDEEIAARFDALAARFKQETYNATAFDVSGSKPRILRRFDPKADIVIAPLLVGG